MAEHTEVFTKRFWQVRINNENHAALGAFLLKTNMGI
jgi:hypothetical protein